MPRTSMLYFLIPFAICAHRPVSYMVPTFRWATFVTDLGKNRGINLLNVILCFAWRPLVAFSFSVVTSAPTLGGASIVNVCNSFCNHEGFFLQVVVINLAPNPLPGGQGICGQGVHPLGKLLSKATSNDFHLASVLYFISEFSSLRRVSTLANDFFLAGFQTIAGASLISARTY